MVLETSKMVVNSITAGAAATECKSCIYRLIAEYIQQAGVDVALLQEVFVQADAERLAAAAAQGSLKYAQYMHSGFLGGELLILSRWPILYTRCVASQACPCC